MSCGDIDIWPEGWVGFVANLWRGVTYGKGAVGGLRNNRRNPRVIHSTRPVGSGLTIQKEKCQVGWRSRDTAFMMAHRENISMNGLLTGAGFGFACQMNCSSVSKTEPDTPIIPPTPINLDVVRMVPHRAP